MVFERKHTKSDNKIADVSGIINNYNNTNASSYINKYRMRQMRQNINLKQGDGFDADVPPSDYDN